MSGGRPQAAFVAVAAWAILPNYTSDLPRHQPVSFVTPVGGRDGGKMKVNALCALIGLAV